ncbi:hypothetical protein CBO05C_3455 [Clostridium botulinum B str. Osaka05]|uniref:Uncharacterized protein n=1 Tax=Clostridium botulinum B str. Osaka05 TaxID=1407017 RepID=A0A0S6UAD7_CLOBO|nr:hypothetical protein CBO05C_3455 [Clostridium botulinum B str. Osaka05]
MNKVIYKICNKKIYYVKYNIMLLDNTYISMYMLQRCIYEKNYNFYNWIYDMYKFVWMLKTKY